MTFPRAPLWPSAGTQTWGGQPGGSEELSPGRGSPEQATVWAELRAEPLGCVTWGSSQLPWTGVAKLGGLASALVGTGCVVTPGGQGPGTQWLREAPSPTREAPSCSMFYIHISINVPYKTRRASRAGGRVRGWCRKPGLSSQKRRGKGALQSRRNKIRTQHDRRPRLGAQQGCGRGEAAPTAPVAAPRRPRAPWGRLPVLFLIIFFFRGYFSAAAPLWG